MSFQTLEINYAFVVFFLASGAGFVSAVVWLNGLVAGTHTSPTKRRRYECGEISTKTAWVQYNVRFYLYALLFVLFDVEAAFMLPWAVAYRKLVENGDFLMASADMVIFMFVLGTALVYAWKKGATKWV